MSRLNSRRVNEIAIFLAVLVSVPALLSADTSFYVSPQGNDSWSGTIAQVNAAKTDGPLATPGRARDAVRTFNAKTKDESITVILDGGTYFLAEPLTFSPEDSGSAKAPIVWTAQKGQTPIFSAGRRVGNWSKTTVNGRDAWQATLPGGDGAFLFRELWVNGARLSRARWPKQGTLAVAETSKARTHAEWRHPESEFPFNPGDFQSWPTASDGEAVLTSRWTEARLPIERIDETEHRLHSTKAAGFHPETGDRYYIENVKECLTEPGEWYLDPHSKTVYLIPPAGISSPNDAEVIAPSLPQVMRLQGDVAGKHYIEHITFRGLTFSHNEWYYDHVAPGEKPEPTRTGCNQASEGVPGAVWGEGVRSCVFDHCTIAHVGSYGLQLARACQHNRITYASVTDLAGGGIKIGEPAIRADGDDQTFDNEVSDSRIIDGGNLFPSSVGAWIGQSHDNTLAHNEIAQFLYSGISAGWTWGYGNALSQNNHIEYNHIHHIGIKHDGDLPILSDMAGIYTLANQTGTVIRNNIFHDISALKYGGWGIYFDEGTTNIVAENNLVYRTSHAGFHQHFGKDNIVRNNIFAFGRDAQIQRTRLEDHTSFTFENNIVCWNTGVLLAGNWSKPGAIFNHNTYIPLGKEPIVLGKLLWEQWRAVGMDKDSTFSGKSPFIDAEHGDFRMMGSSGKSAVGFVPFDMAGVGPRP